MQNAASFSYPFGLLACIFMIAIFLMTLFAHRKNLAKLFSGNESRTSIFSKYKNASKNAINNNYQSEKIKKE
jgi:hypothetical protein